MDSITLVKKSEKHYKIEWKTKPYQCHTSLIPRVKGMEEREGAMLFLGGSLTRDGTLTTEKATELIK